MFVTIRQRLLNNTWYQVPGISKDIPQGKIGLYGEHLGTYLSIYDEARPRERSDRGRFLPLGKKAPSYRGAYRVPFFNWYVCVSVSVCVTCVVFTDCESCTRPISTNPGSMEAGRYGLTLVTCFLTCRLELDAVAGLLWISWCVWVGERIFPFFFFFERTWPASSMRPPLASFTSLLGGVMIAMNTIAVLRIAGIEIYRTWTVCTTTTSLLGYCTWFIRLYY